MNVLSLFSGIGGLDLAAEWAGMQTVAFCERDRFCQKVLAKHWPGVPCFDDVTTLKANNILETIDIVFGGYPCQPFSVAGNRKGKEDARYLWPEFSRIIDELRPSWVVGENVAGHITSGLDEVLCDLENKNYETKTFCIPACSIGAHHTRERVFAIAYASGNGRDDLKKSRGVGASDEHDEERSNKVSHSQRRRRVWSELERVSESNWFRGTEPCIRGDVNGVPQRLDRLKALGNAVVPQQAYPVFKAIMDIERVLRS